QPSELIQAFGVASFLGELRGGRGALVEIRKVHPESGEAYVSVAGSRSAPGFHWSVPAGNMCGNDISMIEIVSACSCASAASSLPFGASMVSMASMFVSIAPIKILRAKIVSFGGGPFDSWPRANGAAMSTPMANAAAGRKPERQLIRAPAAPARQC